MTKVRFYFPTCTLNWVQARTRAPMGVCQTLSPSSKNGKGLATPDYIGPGVLHLELLTLVLPVLVM